MSITVHRAYRYHRWAYAWCDGRQMLGNPMIGGCVLLSLMYVHTYIHILGSLYNRACTWRGVHECQMHEGGNVTVSFGKAKKSVTDRTFVPTEWCRLYISYFDPVGLSFGTVFPTRIFAVKTCTLHFSATQLSSWETLTISLLEGDGRLCNRLWKHAFPVC